MKGGIFPAPNSLCTNISGLPNKSLVQKGKDSKGGKFAKERLTVLHMCNQDGSDKRKPMVIGRAKRPRAFKEIPTDQLPVQMGVQQKGMDDAGDLRAFSQEIR